MTVAQWLNLLPWGRGKGSNDPPTGVRTSSRRVVARMNLDDRPAVGRLSAVAPLHDTEGDTNEQPEPDSGPGAEPAQPAEPPQRTEPAEPTAAARTLDARSAPRGLTMRPHRPHLFTSYQAASAAGITYRQLDYWTRIGLVSMTKKAHGSGSQRRFSHREVLLVAAVAELMRLGAGAETALRLWLYLDGLDVHSWPTMVVVTPDAVRAAEAGGSGWYVDLQAAARAANAVLIGAELEKVG